MHLIHLRLRARRAAVAWPRDAAAALGGAAPLGDAHRGAAAEPDAVAAGAAPAWIEHVSVHRLGDALIVLGVYVHAGSEASAVQAAQEAWARARGASDQLQQWQLISAGDAAAGRRGLSGLAASDASGAGQVLSGSW